MRVQGEGDEEDRGIAALRRRGVAGRPGPERGVTVLEQRVKPVAQRRDLAHRVAAAAHARHVARHVGAGEPHLG